MINVLTDLIITAGYNDISFLFLEIDLFFGNSSDTIAYVVFVVAQQLYREKKLQAIFHPHGFCSPIGKHEPLFSSFQNFT